ncbi:hypothetical protein T492DRAFT_380510 [Pavlovales sp. CCMP2436]|nr:hypothetical protein T492DRAFT_380510 [Pavlovales sp. CCMP2436]
MRAPKSSICAAPSPSPTVRNRQKMANRIFRRRQKIQNRAKLRNAIARVGCVRQKGKKKRKKKLCARSQPCHGCVLPAVSEAASGLEDLLDEISGAAPFSEFVQAAARIGPTYQLKELLVSLGHSHVDGKSPNELLQAALSTAAAKHADTHVRLGARTEAIQSIQNEVRAEEARMRTRCRDLLIRAQDRSLNVASLVAKGRDAAEGVGDVELRAGDAEMRGAEEGGYSLLYECAEHTCRLEMQPARKQSRGLES